MAVNISGRAIKDIDLDNRHQKTALNNRLAGLSALLIPNTQGNRKDLKILEKGFDAPLYEMEELHDVRSEFSPEEKITAVMAFLATGSPDVAEGFCNVSARTLRHWKQKAKWWPQAVKICRLRMADSLDTKFTEIVHLATEQLVDRVIKGDVVVNKAGKRVRMPLKGKELAGIISTIFDKRAASRGDPTLITEKRTETTQNKLEDLRDTFEDFAEKWKDDREETVVSEQ